MKSCLEVIVDSETRDRADAVLANMGLDLSDAVRMMLIQIVDEGRLPFAVKQPNPVTINALNELDRGHGTSFASERQLFDDLGI